MHKLVAENAETGSECGSGFFLGIGSLSGGSPSVSDLKVYLNLNSILCPFARPCTDLLPKMQKPDPNADLVFFLRIGSVSGGSPSVSDLKVYFILPLYCAIRYCSLEKQ